MEWEKKDFGKILALQNLDNMKQCFAQYPQNFNSYVGCRDSFNSDIRAFRKRIKASNQTKCILKE